MAAFGGATREADEQSNNSTAKLHAGWQACTDEATNGTYFWNIETNETTWDRPNASEEDSSANEQADPEKLSGRELFRHAVTSTITLNSSVLGMFRRSNVASLVQQHNKVASRRGERRMSLYVHCLPACPAKHSQDVFSDDHPG